MNKQWLTLVLTILLTAGLSAHAVSPLQNVNATLRIINDSGQMICYIFISPVAASIWGDNWLGDNTIPSGEVYSFRLPSGKYDILLLDCDGNELLVEYHLDLLDPYELRLTGPDLCSAAYQEGERFYHYARYSEALQQFQQVLSCYREVGSRIGEGAALNSIGGVYQAQGRYVDALTAFEQALAIVLEVDDLAGEGAMLNNIGGVYYAQGRYAEAVEAYQKALVILRDLGDRVGEGTTLGNIGLVYHAQGYYAEALDASWQALAIHREVGHRPGEGVTLNNIGLSYHAQGRHAEALEAFQRALSIQQDLGDRVSEGTILNGIGAVYHAQGRYAEALEAYQRALDIRWEVGDRAGEGTTLNNIGTLYDSQGRYAEALDLFLRALAIHRAVGNRPMEGTTLNNIGEVYRAQGRHAEALEVFWQAIVISQEVGDWIGEGITLNNIGLVYRAQGRYFEALDAYQQAQAILQDAGDRAGEGATLNNVGEIYHTQGRYAEAVEAYQEALVILRDLGDRVGEGTTLGNIGLVYHAQGYYAEALEYHQQALTILQEVGDRTSEGTTLNNIGLSYLAQGRHAEALEPHQQALIIAREVGDQAGEGTTLNNIGAVYSHQGRYAEALDTYQQAMDVFESLRAIAGSEAGRAGFIAQYASLYNRAVGLYHQQGQDTQAFHTSERGRARAFLDSLVTGHMQLADDETADLLAREQEAYTARQTAQDALAKARAASPPDPALVADLEAQLAAADEEYTAALAAIESRGDQLEALVPGRGAVLELAEVQALLDGQTTLLSYYVLGDEGTLASIITSERLTVVELPEATPDNLRTALADLYQWLNLENPHPLPLRNLHTPLVGIIPHQQLHYVPFAALTDGEIYFGQQYTLFTLPSASALPFIQENARQAAIDGQELAVVVGNPATGDYDPVASLATERDSLGGLPFAEEEARAIAALYGTEPFVGQDATESIVRAQSSQADILHLAAHGRFNPSAPLSSLIALASDDAYDGWLTVGEVYGLDLKKTDLVVLSACQSNLGELSRGDELVGLTRAFVYAGAPTVIASLWSVDDAATNELMVAFYRHWQAGMGKAEALQTAQAEIRETHSSPFYWAAFVLNGDPGPVSAPVPTIIPSLTPTTAATPSPTPVQPATEGEGGGLCGGLGSILPLVLVGLWSARRREKGR